MPKIQHEANEQIKLFRWASFATAKYPCLTLLHHIPNGGSRNQLEARNLKLQGVKSGVPDICLPVPRGKYHGLYIEMKYGKTSHQLTSVSGLICYAKMDMLQLYAIAGKVHKK